MKIAIIGGGIFGSTIAIQLAINKHKVTIFEKNNSLMQGASYNNQNRIHLGFHYPRDRQTAIQSKEGFKKFTEAYSDAVNKDFENFYFIASNGSNVSSTEYLNFCDSVGLDYELIDPKKLNFKINNTDLCIKTNEAVYDADILKKLILNQLNLFDVQLNLNCEVLSILLKNNLYEIKSKDQFESKYDYVINCTYERINDFNKETHNYQYDYTIVPIIESELTDLGITIMDGQFMTLLPFGKKKLSLLYHVKHSVYARDNLNNYPKDWSNYKINIEKHKEDIFDQFKESCSFFLPSLKKIKIIDYLQGPRIVLANKQKTDKRPSLIKCVDGNRFFSVLSGKVDHCIEIAEKFNEIVG